MTGKVIFFSSLGMVGLLLIGFGSWMLLTPIVEKPGMTQTSEPFEATKAPHAELQTPTEIKNDLTPASTKIVLTTKTEQPEEILSASPTSSPTSTTWLACPNTFLSQLRVGMKGKLSEEPPLPNRVREQANTTSKIIGLIQPGEIVDILDGPGCSNGWVWWKIRKSDGLTGWTAEGDGSSYWLLPVSP